MGSIFRGMTDGLLRFGTMVEKAANETLDRGGSAKQSLV